MPFDYMTPSLPENPLEAEIRKRLEDEERRRLLLQAQAMAGPQQPSVSQQYNSGLSGPARFAALYRGWGR